MYNIYQIINNGIILNFKNLYKINVFKNLK